jgi:hypothetical protein
MARRHDQVDVRPLPVKLLRKRYAILRTGHVDVGKEDRNFRMQTQHLQGFFVVPRLMDRAPRGLQDFRRLKAKQGLIVNDENDSVRNVEDRHVAATVPGADRSMARSICPITGKDVTLKERCSSFYWVSRHRGSASRTLKPSGNHSRVMTPDSWDRTVRFSKLVPNPSVLASDGWLTPVSRQSRIRR